MAITIQCYGCGYHSPAPQNWGADTIHNWSCGECTFRHHISFSDLGTALTYCEPVDRYRRPDTTDIDERVARDVTEGIRAANAGCNRAAAVMLRRALERACVLAGAPSDIPLFQKIEALERKQVISRIVAASAHAIRAFGNYGAHPDDDGLDEVDEDELETAVKLVVAVVGALPSAPRAS